MSDRWDASVWLYETAGDWDVYSEPDPDDPPEKWCRYIRADLYDRKPCPHVVGETTQHCTLAQDEVRRLTQRAEQAEADRMRAWEHLQRTEYEFQQTEAERDRLRAALERLMRGEGGVNSLEQERIAQEALGHD